MQKDINMLNKNNKIIKKNEIIRIFLKNVSQIKIIPYSFRAKAILKLNSFIKKYNKKNYCVFTKRYYIYKISNTSRMMIKYFVESGLWSGATKLN